MVYTMSMRKIKLPVYKCERCGHIWIPRKPEVPRRCGKCKSPYWNKITTINKTDIPLDLGLDKENKGIGEK